MGIDQSLKNFIGAMRKNGVFSAAAVSKDHIEICRAYFDVSYYRKESGKYSLSEDDAITDYLVSGWKLGLNPSEKFSTNGYLRMYPDVYEAKINPLLHYALHGFYEERSIPCPGSGYSVSVEEISLFKLKGYAVNNENPGEDFPIKVMIDGVLYGEVSNDVPRGDLKRRGLSSGRGGFEIDIPFHCLEAGSHTVELAIPTGEVFTKIINVPRKVIDTNNNLFWNINHFKGVDYKKIKVIVPIYNAYDDLLVCVDRLKKFTPKDVEIFLINDASTDERIEEILRSLDGDDQFKIHRNQENLGFTRTINFGFACSGQADVIILNSDARVTPGWVEGLYTAATSRGRVATVTAMSDRAGAFSAPEIGNDNSLPPGIAEVDYARAFRRRSLRLYPEVPTGNGFCMFISRAAINEVGVLDADSFPRGYGEENDFCMRALRKGWIHLVDDSTYVFHDRSKSFGAEKQANLEAGRKIVDQRYPEYRFLIRTFQTSSKLRLARFRARQAIEDCSSGTGIKPRIVFVLSTRTGGTPQTNGDLVSILQEDFECWVLRCDSKILELSLYSAGEMEVVYHHNLIEKVDPLTHRSTEYDAVVHEWLTSIGPEVVHIRHLAWHSLTLAEIAKNSGAKVFYSFHDFYTLCPSLKLLDDNAHFCGGQCSAGSGKCRIELWQGDHFPPLKNDWVYTWRDNMSRALAFCDGFVTTSFSARERIVRQMPALPASKFHVIPHGRDFPAFEHLQRLPDGSGPIRILVPGNIDEAKGLDLIAEILRLDSAKHFEFHVLGGVHLSRLAGEKFPRLRLHDRYAREDFAERVRAIAPHIGVVLSIWDETYCHTLTEMWSVGLPVAVLDFPTLRDRVQGAGAGWVIEDRSPLGVYNKLLEITANFEDLMDKGAAAIRWQRLEGAGQTCRQMASRYLDVYRGSDVGKECPTIAVVCPANKSLQTAYASTEIRIWERTRNDLDRPVNYIRANVSSLLAQMRMGVISGAIIQRTAVPAGFVAEFLAVAKQTGTPYIFDMDDQLFRVPGDKDPDGYYKSYAPYLEQLLSQASCVTVSTKYLAEDINKYNNNIVVMPNRLSSRLWGGVQVRAPNHDPCLLYMGTKTHDQDMDFIVPALELVRKKFPGLSLKLIGVTGRKALPGWIDIIEIPEEYKSYSNFVPWLRRQSPESILGLAPLVEGDFNKYKSALKILDYGALGLPVVASNVPVYADILKNGRLKGVTLVYNDHKAWADAVAAKLENYAALIEEGQALREWVFKNHGLEESINDFDKAVQAVLR